MSPTLLAHDHPKNRPLLAQTMENLTSDSKAFLFLSKFAPIEFFFFFLTEEGRIDILKMGKSIKV